jgi:hypothetical protein
MKIIFTSIFLVLSMFTTIDNDLTTDDQSLVTNDRNMAGVLSILNSNAYPVRITLATHQSCTLNSSTQQTQSITVAANGGTATISPWNTNPDWEWHNIQGWHTDLNFSFSAETSCSNEVNTSGYLTASFSYLGDNVSLTIN